jgi:F-type H+-transporting ATPase subunit epsilon
VEKKLRLVLATAERPHFQGEAGSVTLPGEDGELGVLPDHAPLLGLLGAGEVRIARAEGPLSFFVAGGFFRVLKNEVTILADEIAPIDTLDVAEAEAKLTAARALTSATEPERRAAAAAARHARARLRCARKRG